MQLTIAGYWMGLSNRGVVVSVPGAQHLVVFSLDLKPLKKIPVPTPRHFACGPGTSLAFVSGGSSGSDSLTVVDLGRGKAVKTLSARRINSEQRHLIKKHKDGVTLTGFGRPTMTPDGKYLFCEGFECLHRFTIRKDRLVYDQMGPRLGSNVQRIEVSPDGRYVAMPCRGGNRARDGHPQIGAYGTFVYRVSDITSAVVAVTGGAYPRALAFDNIAGHIYGQNHDNHLIVFSTDGVKEMEFDFDGPNRSDRTSQLVAHPGGGRLLVVTERNVYYAQFKKGKEAE